MVKIFEFFRGLRKYFFLKLVVWFEATHIFISNVDLYPLVPDYLDRSTYGYNISEYAFNLFVLIVLFFILSFFEAFFRFLYRKFVIKKPVKKLAKHKNKILNILDNLYTIFFTLMLLIAISYMYSIFFLGKPIF